MASPHFPRQLLSYLLLRFVVPYTWPSADTLISSKPKAKLSKRFGAVEETIRSTRLGTTRGRTCGTRPPSRRWSRTRRDRSAGSRPRRRARRRRTARSCRSRAIRLLNLCSLEPWRSSSRPSRSGRRRASSGVAGTALKETFGETLNAKERREK